MELRPGPFRPQGPGLGYNNTGGFSFYALTRFCQAWREKPGLRKGFSLTASVCVQVQQPRTSASPTARLFQHQTSPRLRSQMTSIVMLSAPPAACGQTRHFNYCALVDGDVRREAVRADRVYSPHRVPATVSGIHAETQSGHPSSPTAVPNSETAGVRTLVVLLPSAALTVLHPPPPKKKHVQWNKVEKDAQL